MDENHKQKWTYLMGLTYMIVNIADFVVFPIMYTIVLGIVHTDEAIVETDEDNFEFCQAIIIHLGFFNIAILFF